MTDGKQVRINIAIDEDLHSKIKVYAAQNKMSLKDLVVKALLKIVDEEAAKSGE